ncbi:MAG: flagellar hook-length control protein FliK [Proteocatella sp.]
MNMANAINLSQAPRIKPNQKMAIRNEQRNFKDIMNQSTKETPVTDFQKPSEIKSEEKAETAETVPEDVNKNDKDSDIDSKIDKSDTISREMMAFMNAAQPEIKQIEIVNNEISLKEVEVKNLENIVGEGSKLQKNQESPKNLEKPEVNGTVIKLTSQNGEEIQPGKQLTPVIAAEKRVQQEVKLQEAKSQETKPQETKPQETKLQELKIEAAASGKDTQISRAVQNEAKISVTQEKPAIKPEADTETVQIDQNLKHPEIAKTAETIKIKVGDLQETRPAQFIKEVSQKIYISNAGDNEYEIQLEPEQLGKIKVKISFEQGQTNISLICTNSKTLNLLSENISSLSQLIQDNTKTEVTVNTQEENDYVNDGQRQNEKQQQQEQRNRQNGKEDQNPEFIDQMKLGLWEIEKLKRQYQMSSY